jgi:hypothetical protein
VVALNPLLQVLGDVMDRRARQKPVFPGRRDSGWIGPRPIGADPVRREQRLVLQHPAEEALGSLEIALRREQKVDRVSVLVDGPVQVAPLAAAADFGDGWPRAQQPRSAPTSGPAERLKPSAVGVSVGATPRSP